MKRSDLTLKDLEKLLPKPKVARRCPFDGKCCVDPNSWFCEESPFPVDPVDPDDIGSVWKRERVFVPACARCIGVLSEEA